jgi:hypothetical protein
MDRKGRYPLVLIAFLVTLGGACPTGCQLNA